MRLSSCTRSGFSSGTFGPNVHHLVDMERGEFEYSIAKDVMDHPKGDRHAMKVRVIERLIDPWQEK